jgi:hypothetical protein
MDAATNMIQRGLKKIKDSFIAYTKHLDGTADITRMKEAKVGFSIDWEDSVRAFNTAVASASYSRYSNWHRDALRKFEPECIKAGKRIWDPSYSPSESEFLASDDENSTSRPRGRRSKRKQRTVSQPPPRKSKPTSGKRRA